MTPLMLYLVDILLVPSQFHSSFLSPLQLCVYLGEERVVDLWGSSVGRDNYGPETMQNVFRYTCNHPLHWLIVQTASGPDRS